MKKSSVRGYIVLGILFLVFSVIAFAAPFTKNVAFWMAYIFGVIAIALQIYVFKVSFEHGDNAKSKFYGFPIAKIGVIYLAIQMVVSLLSMILATVVPAFPTWIFTIIDVVVLGVAAIGCITAETMRDEIEKQDVKLKSDVSAMRNLQSLVSSVAVQCDNAELKKLLSDLSDEFKYSDPVSCDDSKPLETEMTEIMKEIQKAVVDGDVDAVKTMCGKVKAILVERNRVCKVGK